MAVRFLAKVLYWLSGFLNVGLENNNDSNHGSNGRFLPSIRSVAGATQNNLTVGGSETGQRQAGNAHPGQLRHTVATRPL